MPYFLEGVTIFIAVLLSDLVLAQYHRHRKRAHMRKLNALSQIAKQRARDVAKDRATRAEGGDSGATVT